MRAFNPGSLAGWGIRYFPNASNFVICNRNYSIAPYGLKNVDQPRGDYVRLALILVSAATLISSGDVVVDLVSRGVPASSAALVDSSFVVEMEGSLAEGDSLLKHYGGVFFLLADSIASGWDVVGLNVNITGAVLVLEREDMFNVLNQIRDGTPESVVAFWILEHTRVFNR